MAVAKLDTYDYILMPGVIRIYLTSTVDPDLVDIMSEIRNSNNQIYVDGYRYRYLDGYDIVNDGDNVYLELCVSYEN